MSMHKSTIHVASDENLLLLLLATLVFIAGCLGLDNNQC